MALPSWGKQGTWEEAEACLGKVLAVVQGADAVEPGAIRRWLEPKQFDCPLHTDEQAARAAGWEGLRAPGAMALSLGLAPYWRPGDPPARPSDPPRQISIPVIFDVPAPCTLSFATSLEVQFAAPLRLGDRIACTTEFVGLTRKTLRVGDGAFFRQRDSYRNQRGETLAVAHLDIFRFSPPKSGAGRGGQSGQGGQGGDDAKGSGQGGQGGDDAKGSGQGGQGDAAAQGSGQNREAPPSQALDWSRQRRFGELSLGEETHSFQLPLTLQRLVMEAGANRDFSLIHHDREAARATGAPDAYANAFLLLGLFERLTREWGGLRARIEKLGPMTMRTFNAAGDLLSVKGRVAQLDPTRRAAGLELWIESQRGLTTQAQARLVLPED